MGVLNEIRAIDIYMRIIRSWYVDRTVMYTKTGPGPISLQQSQRGWGMKLAPTSFGVYNLIDILRMMRREEESGQGNATTVGLMVTVG